MLVVTIFGTSYSSSCRHHVYHL